MTTKEEGGIVHRIDAQTRPVPFEHVAFAGRQIFNRANRAPRILGPDTLAAEMQPKIVGSARQRNRARHRIISSDGLLDEPDNTTIIDLKKSQLRGLQ